MNKKIILSVVAVILLQAPYAFGAEFLVNSTEDKVDVFIGDGICGANDGSCTLRAAVQEANETAEHDTVTLPNGDFILNISGGNSGDPSKDDLDITSDLIIQGQGRDVTSIDANAVNRAFYVHENANVVIEDLSIVGGDSSLSTIPIGNENDGTLTLRHCAIMNAKAYSGSAVYSRGNLIIDDCNISENESTYGDTLNCFGAETIINDSLIGNNKASTEIEQEGTVQIWGRYWTPEEMNVHISDTTIEGNDGSEAIEIEQNDLGIKDFTNHINVEISNSRIINNGGRGIYVFNENLDEFEKTINLKVTGSLIAGNKTKEDGGGVLFSGGPYDASSKASLVTIVNTSIIGNEAGGHGGGVYNTGNMNITNSTIAENKAGAGCGIYMISDDEKTMKLNVNNSTIVHNVQIANNDENVTFSPCVGIDSFLSLIKIQNSIIAKNYKDDDAKAYDTCRDCYGHDVDVMTFIGRDYPTPNTKTADPLLGQLVQVVDNMFVYYPLAGSPAINAGDNASCELFDQLGSVRIGTCDLGAVESLCGNGTLDGDEVCDEGVGISKAVGECTSQCITPAIQEDEEDSEDEIATTGEDGTNDQSNADTSESEGGSGGGCNVSKANNFSVGFLMMLFPLVAIRTIKS